MYALHSAHRSRFTYVRNADKDYCCTNPSNNIHGTLFAFEHACDQRYPGQCCKKNTSVSGVNKLYGTILIFARTTVKHSTTIVGTKKEYDSLNTFMTSEVNNFMILTIYLPYMLYPSLTF